jgi:hypothetical protein
VKRVDRTARVRPPHAPPPFSSAAIVHSRRPAPTF